ncbi:hypothetical protein RA307_02590 [Xanthobacteraceae bacterium Astr-EGSB]|uniref:hypothetical protein n=1 Tax=Astrobacterium formosum TaxID=3069710 RepID=UPI0027AEDAAD|nr:hypothetical protein [Xanthobacteraceae bacterium Astr-EGSB]
MAQTLAALCRSVFAIAADRMESATMEQHGHEELVQQVAAACQTAIARAMAAPSEAIGLARGLDGALTSLKLVQSEVAKGTAGARAVVDNAEALTRQALEDVLAFAPDPARARAALDAAPPIAPGSEAPKEALAPARAADHRPVGMARSLPTFGEVSQSYIDMRVANDGLNHPDIKYLELRRRTFIDVVGDRSVDQYFARDLQDYVSQMQFWPANATKRETLKDLTTLEILAANKDRHLKTVSRKTLQDGYVANIRTMVRYGMADFAYRDPFAGVQIRWPENLKPPTPREGVDDKVINRVFRTGIASGLLDEALLPLTSVLTSRRLGLLTYLRGSDIREKHGVMVAQSSGIVLVNGQWRRVPMKTDESMTFFVLHDFLSKIGFVDWARRQDGWVFAAPHEHPDPSKYVSKVMNRLLRRCGAAGKHAEVFHSLRGDAITAMRGGDVQSRAVRLQAGHELGDVHERYGFRALSAEECRRLARLPLPDGVEKEVWELFRTIDFDSFAARRRGAGRKRKDR